MRIERGASNSFTLAVRPTLSPSKWLLRFVKVDDEAVYQLCIAEAIATVGNPVQLTFTEVSASPDAQDAEVTLSPGQWDLYVYEQDDTSLNWTLAERLAYQQLIEVVGAAAPDPEPTNPCGADCPTECEVIAAAEAATVVSCTPDGNKPTLYVALTADDAITPEVIVVAMDGASKTDSVKAIICDTCSDGLFKTSDGATTIATVPSGTSVNAGDSVIYYADENGDTQSTDPFDTAFTGSKIYPDTVIPSREILNSDLDPAASRKATLYDLINDTVPQAIGATVQLKDSAGNNIGSADVYQANTSSNKTAPDATAVVRNSVPTTLSTTSIRSNASQNIAVADSTITKPDGTTVGLPATVALDVRTYRSGIAYQFGLKDWSGQSTVYRTGGEASLYGAGWFGYTPPVYPTSFARLSNWNTLTANNSFGNTNRFTDEAGNAAASSGNRYVIDHLSGLMWYIPSSLPTAVSWNNAVDACEAATTGGYTDWVMPPVNILMDLFQYESGIGMNYSPFGITVTLWSGTTNPYNTAQAKAMGAGSSVSEGNSLKTATNQYIYCRKHLNV